MASLYGKGKRDGKRPYKVSGIIRRDFRASKDGPEELPPQKNKKNKKWCKGVKGREHSPVEKITQTYSNSKRTIRYYSMVCEICSQRLEYMRRGEITFSCGHTQSVSWSWNAECYRCRPLRPRNATSLYRKRRFRHGRSKITRRYYG